MDEETLAPSYTYKVENGRIMGNIDGYEAMRQAIEKALMTERFVFEIYTDQYGNDLPDLIGKDLPFVKTALEDVLKEALQTDDRVDDVAINSIDETNRSTLLVNLTVKTVFGNVKTETEVNV
ncbi:DUF2634 domain-containing protein [Lactococcus lactis]|uniref:DUF2634 domain-containing protein n=1 Tax=Lactococcus lactis TaxID=1358 RepID=A0A6B3RXB6_9LACT|nr:DUF2634 domain-containing protein [Lactococcus lactis]MCT1174175.1 DUF2634 domain-containing protein [Lactococcus lactis]MCT1186480.1 DUF2634 domain-containing protein [Lactococcus lactis]MCT1189574.1 DUF2634 domain-containing protein [Lactococcus lactis]MCT1195250.1 DUF2634 domain-containing protein [Lactococcus lactis]NEX49338.1 DUF2634 domain-containing protein [Lactococcus lactis]